MSAWGTRRQLSFVLVFLLMLILAFVLFIALNRRVPTCTDNIANQGEVDVDCGGPCLKVCPVEASDIIVLWSRVFKVKDGKYDVAAYIENPNSFGVKELEYAVRIYDTDNIPVKDAKGKTYLNPHERVLVFVPLVDLGFRIPTRAFVTFPEAPNWQRLKSDIRQPVLSVRDQSVSESDGLLTLRAEVSNDSEFPTDQIELYAFLYDVWGNVNHASKSFLPGLSSGASSEIAFTWPGIASTTVKSADIFYRVNLVEGNILHEQILLR
jgi:hypothetical protein